VHAQARRLNLGLGPVVNGAGLCLTARFAFESADVVRGAVYRMRADAGEPHLGTTCNAARPNQCCGERPITHDNTPPHEQFVKFIIANVVLNNIKFRTKETKSNCVRKRTKRKDATTRSGA
jgi:hypothetical protein